MEVRNIKQFIIILIFCSFLAMVAAAIYFLTRSEPSCSDGIKNQGEQGVDCGGSCFPCKEKVVLDDLKIISTEWVFDIDNKYDIVAKISNPNQLYGAASFDYTAKLLGDGGQVLAESHPYEGFALPGQTKHLIIQALDSSSEPKEVLIEISNVKWNKFTDYEEPNLVTVNNHYERLSSGAAGFSRVYGTLINQSQYDFEKIVVLAIIRDAQGKLLAVNSQQMNTVRNKEQRDYDMTFSHSFPGLVDSAYVEPQVNVFDSQNYIRIQGTPEKWDER